MAKELLRTDKEITDNELNSLASRLYIQLRYGSYDYGITIDMIWERLINVGYSGIVLEHWGSRDAQIGIFIACRAILYAVAHSEMAYQWISYGLERVTEEDDKNIKGLIDSVHKVVKKNNRYYNSIELSSKDAYRWVYSCCVTDTMRMIIAVCIQTILKLKTSTREVADAQRNLKVRLDKWNYYLKSNIQY